MPLIRNLLFHATRRAVNDERFRQKAIETIEKEIKPRIDAALSKAKPRVEETRRDIKNITVETKPLENPAKFTGRITRRILEEFKK